MKTLSLFICALSFTNAYKVLVVYPFPTRSLNNLGEGIVRHLLDAGHEVTYITPYPRNLNKPRLREIDISENAATFENDNHMNISYILEHGIELSSDVVYLQEACRELAEKTILNKNVQALLDPKEAFDVVVADLIETELHHGFAALYGCPHVWSYSMGAHWLSMRLIDDPPNSAYSIDYIMPYAPPFSITERLAVFWKQMHWRFSKFFTVQPKEKEAFKKLFGPAFTKRGKPMPEYDDLIYNASLILSNEHLATSDIPKTPQNWKLVGGYHIEVPPKPLPEDLQNIMDNATNGVIFFSMGSLWRSELVPKQVTEALLEVFAEVDATIIWKYEADLPNRPKNVHTVKWAPQQSILAHPNCKLFISHGGLLSSTEAIHFAVPTIGIPVSYDQHLNLKKAVNLGYAVMVDLSYNLPQDLRSAIKVIYNNPKYKQKAMEVSTIYHDRPVAPGKELVYWIEYAVKYRGATHLRSPSLKVPFYQKAHLDLIAILFALIVMALALKRLATGPKKGKKEKRS